MQPGADVLNNRTEIWLPLGLGPLERRSRRAHYLHVIGRLKDQVTVEAAQTELQTLNDAWGERVGVSNHMFAPLPADAAARASNPDAGHLLQMSPLHDQIVGPASRAIWMLQVAAGLVLLIVCANLANLLAARAAIRRRELAVRMALGATRVRLLTQSIAEGALLSIIGGALALWIARVGLQALTQAYPRHCPICRGQCRSPRAALCQWRRTRDKRVLRTRAASAHRRAGCRCRTHGCRHQRCHWRDTALHPPQPGRGRSGSGGDSRGWCGLLLRTIDNLGNVDAGFNRSRLATFSINLPGATYPSGIRVQTFQRLLDALRAVPGVEAATAMSGLPPHRPALKMNTRIANATAPSVGRFTSLTIISR